jgi:hypothetical protein
VCLEGHLSKNIFVPVRDMIVSSRAALMGGKVVGGPCGIRGGVRRSIGVVEVRSGVGDRL